MAPSLWLVIGGVIWGLFWIPLRMLGEAGFQAAWSGFSIYAVSALIMLPVIVMRARSLCAGGLALLICGALTGTALSLYATSIYFTDVIRVILLFYLAPVWGTLLGLVFLGERLTWFRVLALIMGLGGLIVVLSPNGAFPRPQGIGDWMALLSGIAWSLGSLQLYRLQRVAPIDQMIAFILGGLIVTALMLALGGEIMGKTPEFSDIQAAWVLILVIGILTLPMFFLTIWPCAYLTPGRVGVLLMSEVVVAVISAAVLTDETFGLREALGTGLIVSAALVEVAGPFFTRTSKTHKQS
ncbi:MAG: DMT family transporter [Ascidiaceihabitans sp.]|nr:DMT family transporter [Ascidiaceihabitans sp.]